MALMRNVMLSQDCLYTPVERGLEVDQARIIGSIHIGLENRRLHLSTKALEIASFRNFVPKLLSSVIIG
jgi:hypothetical protein